jgi:hypothetical protein
MIEQLRDYQGPSLPAISNRLNEIAIPHLIKMHPEKIGVVCVLVRERNIELAMKLIEECRPAAVLVEYYAIPDEVFRKRGLLK